MKLDLGSFAFNIKVQEGTGTPSWGTHLGQGVDKKIIVEDAENLFTSMVYSAVPDIDQVGCPLGKGGNKRKDFEFCLASIFKKVYVNEIHVDNASFLLLVVKSVGDEFHKNRRTLKYSRRMTYRGDSINEDCISKIKQTLGYTNEDAWFVSHLYTHNQDELHLFSHKLKNQTYANSKDKSNALNSIVDAERTQLETFLKKCDSASLEKESDEIHDEGITEDEKFSDVCHYTSLDSAIKIMDGCENGKIGLLASRSDCLNDPNECRILLEEVKDGSVNFPYVLSFCNSIDNPVMWRLYNSKIAFQFSRDVIENELKNDEGNLLFREVDYVGKASDAKLGNEFFTKYEDYKVEDEWRIIDTTEPFTHKNERYGMIQLRRMIEIPSSSLVSIIVYEFDNTKYKLIEDQLKKILDSKSLNSVEIKQTNCAAFVN